MRIISRKTLREFWEVHPQAQSSLLVWYRRSLAAKWNNLVDVRQIFPSADGVSNFVVFNIGGNRYRLITFIDYQYQTIFVRAVLTHAEYDKQRWKNDDWFNSTE